MLRRAARGRDAEVGDDELVTVDARSTNTDLSMFRDVLARCALDRPARDGDCLLVAPRVTGQLRARGFEASTVGIIGWLNEAAGVIAFFHAATFAGGYLLDATARQFRSDLPDQWVAPVREYLDQLAEATGVHSVTAHADRAAEPPPRKSVQLANDADEDRLVQMPKCDQRPMTMPGPRLV